MRASERVLVQGGAIDREPLLHLQIRASTLIHVYWQVARHANRALRTRTTRIPVAKTWGGAFRVTRAGRRMLALPTVRPQYSYRAMSSVMLAARTKAVVCSTSDATVTTLFALARKFNRRIVTSCAISSTSSISRC